jgi:hypothetical protein
MIGFADCDFDVLMSISNKSQEAFGKASWCPLVPKVKVELPYSTESGISKEQFEDFFGKLERQRYEGFYWEWSNGTVTMYEYASTKHGFAARSFDIELGFSAFTGGWERSLTFLGTGRLKNPNQYESNWEPDGAYKVKGRNGPVGHVDYPTPYPTVVLEVACLEPTIHVMNKGRALLSPDTTIQIVIIILIRPEIQGKGSLQLWKLQRDGLDVHFELGNPNCTVEGDPDFQLRLPVRLLFDDAPIPPALVGVENVLLDLFAWKRRYLGLP